MVKKILVFVIILFQISSNTEAKKAPGLALYNIDGNLITLSSLTKEKNVIISFWASYCRPCANEIPQLVFLEKKYAKQKNIKLILINIDKEGKSKAVTALNMIGASSECLLDSYQVAARKYVTDLKIPAVFLISTSGEILFEAIGESKDNMDNLEKSIINLK
jgi:thiol-disulfide isomerase/thioredoxin